MPSLDDVFEGLSEVQRNKLAKQALRDIGREKDRTPFYGKLDETIKVLTERYKSLAEAETFEPGQLVSWKPGLKNRILPIDEEPAIVIQMLNEPIFATEVSSGSPAFREPLDLVLGLIDEDGDFMIFHFESRRFQKYSQPQTTSDTSE